MSCAAIQAYSSAAIQAYPLIEGYAFTRDLKGEAKWK